MSTTNFQQPSPQFSPPVSHIIKIGIVLLGEKFTLKSRLKTLHIIFKAKNNSFGLNDFRKYISNTSKKSAQKSRQNRENSVLP